jgi:hypothetical protein
MSAVHVFRYCHVEWSEAESRHLAVNRRHYPDAGRFLRSGPLEADLQSK